jgi:hypothetical protein
VIQIIVNFSRVKIMLTSFPNCGKYNLKRAGMPKIYHQGGDEGLRAHLKVSAFWNVLGLSWMLLWESKTRSLRLNAKEGER